MNSTTKYIIFTVVTIVISFFYLKPILMHENEYRLVVVNISERTLNEITFSGAGLETKKIGPIKIGHMQDYYFIPSQDGDIKYSINLNKKDVTGILKENLKKNETGEVYIVIGEMHKIKIYDDYDSAY